MDFIVQPFDGVIREALESYERIGMPRHIEMTRVLLARCR